MADWKPPESRFISDSAGREFHFIHVDNGKKQLGVHFSAFFGDWGDDPKYRKTFGGYFHRLRMLGSDPSIDWLFLCDAHGADNNGTYYIGRQDDRFVEKAIEEILHEIGIGTRYRCDDIVMVGSSMGATAALRFGLRFHVRGIVAISPHIDLDICALLQGRERHVAWILTDGDSQGEHNQVLTREISRLVSEQQGILPSLFIQTCRDDAGVYREQVVPLLTAWKIRGSIWADIRRYGGHTSEFATQALLLDCIHRLLDGRSIPITEYQKSADYQPYGSIEKFVRAIRRSGHRIKRMLPATSAAR